VAGKTEIDVVFKKSGGVVFPFVGGSGAGKRMCSNSG